MKITHKGLLTATLIRETPKTLVVRLPGGKVIKRHKVKHAL